MKFLIGNLKMLLRKFKTATFINIAGLSVAFAVIVVVALQVAFDLNYNRDFKDSDELFIAETDFGNAWGITPSMNWDLPVMWKDRIPEIKNYCLIGYGSGNLQFRKGSDGEDGPTHPIRVLRATEGFMDVFAPEIIAGDASGTLSIDDHCLISEGYAKSVFGDEDPVGQMLTASVEGNPISLTVDAVYKDFPRNSSVSNGLYVRTQNPNNPGTYNHISYFRIDPADKDTVVAKMNDPKMREGDNQRYAKQTYFLTNLSDFYLYGGAGDGSSTGNSGIGEAHIGFTMYLAVIGLLILVVAIINFINLSMAMGPSRVRTINIHKILGIKNGSMMLQLSLESVVVALVGVVIGCGIIYWFSGTTMTSFFYADLKLEHNIVPIAMAAVGFLLVAFAVGAYSARYASSFDAAIALKSSFALSRKGAGLRNTLIVVQFVTAIFFICFSWFVKIQYDFMSNYRVGYEKDNIVLVPAQADSIARATFAQELRKNPAIIDITVTESPGNIGGSWAGEIEGEEVGFAVWPSDYNTLDFFGVEMVAGDGFSAETGGSQIIFNREFLRRHNLTEDIIGKNYGGDIRIAGIVEDVNFESLEKTVQPMAFLVMPNWTPANNAIKISGTDVAGTTKFIEETWNKIGGATVYNTPYSLTFLDERLDGLYRRELGTSQLIGILGLIAVLIAVMGVFGIVMFNTRYKRREIAIRKVNGATIAGIALMLNRNMLILLGVAFVLAAPLVFVFIGRWVEGYAYKAAIPWWLYPAAGLAVALISLATVSWQSYRAASANPVKALKAE